MTDDVFPDKHDIFRYDAERLRARSALTGNEEKKLMRRVDWYLMPLCSLMFPSTNIDVNNVGRPLCLVNRWRIPLQSANVRIMNAGTSQNTLTELK